MQRYWDLPKADRLNITDEQFRVFIQVESVLAGIKVPRKPEIKPLPERPKAERPQGKTMFYVVAHVPDKEHPSRTDDHDLDPLFETVAQAEKFIALKPKKQNSNYNYTTDRYEHSLIEPTHYGVQTKTVVNEDELRLYNKLMAEYSEVETANRKEQSRYETEYRKAIAAGNAIRKNYENLSKRRTALKQLATSLDDFFAVTKDGNMAAKLLCKTEQPQDVYDALSTFGFSDPEAKWETVEIFSLGCLREDNDPYRDIKDEGLAF